MTESKVRLGDLVNVVVYFPAGDIGTKRQVARYISNRYGVPQSRIVVYRPQEWQIEALVEAFNLVPLDQWFPNLEEGWSPYVIVRGVDLAE
jgi:hypothetical protein